jgi:hypothetical protein
MLKLPIINRTSEFAIRLLLRTSFGRFFVSVNVRVSVWVSVSCVVNIYVLIIQNKTTVSRFMLRMACSSSCLDQCSCVLSSPFLFLFLHHRH